MEEQRPGRSGAASGQGHLQGQLDSQCAKCSHPLTQPFLFCVFILEKNLAQVHEATWARVFIAVLMKKPKGINQLSVHRGLA